MRCKLWEIQVCSSWLMIAKIGFASFYFSLRGSVMTECFDNLEGNGSETHVYAKSILRLRDWRREGGHRCGHILNDPLNIGRSA